MKYNIVIRKTERIPYGLIWNDFQDTFKWEKIVQNSIYNVDEHTCKIRKTTNLNLII